jgi:hypothetical protein
MGAKAQKANENGNYKKIIVISMWVITPPVLLASVLFAVPIAEKGHRMLTI